MSNSITGTPINVYPTPVRDSVTDDYVFNAFVPGNNAAVHFGNNSFAEGNNILTLQTGSILNGDAVSKSAGNILKLQGHGSEDNHLGVGTLGVGNGAVSNTNSTLVYTPNMGIGFEQLTMGDNDNLTTDDMTTVANDTWKLSGDVTLNGTANNSLWVRNGTLQLGGESAYVDGSSNPILGGTLTTPGEVRIDKNGTLRLGDYDTATATGGTSGMVQRPNGDLTVPIMNNGHLIFNHANDLVYDGVISGMGTIVKTGPDRLILTQANDHDGDTTVESGILELGEDEAFVVAGFDQPGDPAFVTMDGATTVVDSEASLEVENGTFAQMDGSALEVTVDDTGIPPVTAFDVMLQNAGAAPPTLTLHVFPALTAAMQPGDEILIIKDTSTHPVSGTFGSLPEGASIAVNGITLLISYQGGDGNDVVLYMPGGRKVIDPTVPNTPNTGVGSVAAVSVALAGTSIVLIMGTTLLLWRAVRKNKA
jgi:autotransporter-associated beta strand protein